MAPRLWSGSRLAEFTSLRWDCLRQFGDEIHFDWVGKWGVRKWARVPLGLYRELEAIRMADNPFVFAAYTGQLRAFHAGTKFASKVGDEFSPEALASWFQDRIGDWVEKTGAEHASPHVFRKTNLQFARDGEDLNRKVADDAQVTPRVMTEHYVTESEEAFRNASNRTYGRILASLIQDGIAERYGHVPASEQERLMDELRKATLANDWDAVKAIAERLQTVNSCEPPDQTRNPDFTESPELVSL